MGNQTSDKTKKREKDFIFKAEQLGYEIDEHYSGRGMYGRECPAVTCQFPNDFIAEMGMTGLLVDNMGKSYVVYTG